jgi:hypothetical protein
MARPVHGRAFAAPLVGLNELNFRHLEIGRRWV